MTGNETLTKDSAAESRLRAILETVVDGIITIDGSGNIQTANPAALHLFGYPAEELVGRNIKILMPEPYADEHDGYLHNYLTTGKRKIIGTGREVTGKRMDGSTFPMELAVNEMRRLINPHVDAALLNSIVAFEISRDAARHGGVKARVDTG